MSGFSSHAGCARLPGWNARTQLARVVACILVLFGWLNARNCTVCCCNMLDLEVQYKQRVQCNDRNRKVNHHQMGEYGRQSPYDRSCARSPAMQKHKPLFLHLTTTLTTAGRSESNKSNFTSQPRPPSYSRHWSILSSSCNDDLMTAACHDAFSAVQLHVSPPKNTRLSFADFCVSSERPSSARDRTNLCRLHPECGASIASTQFFT